MSVFSRGRSSLSSAYLNGAELAQSVVHALWEIRSDLLGLPEEQELTARPEFEAFLRRADTRVMLFSDRNKKPQGFYTFTPFPVATDEGQALVVFSKYWYVREEFQGHPTIMLAAWKMLPQLIRSHGLRRIFFATFSAPQSYASLSRTFGRAWTLHEPDIPGLTRKALAAFVTEFGGETWDAQQGLVLDAIPHEFVEKCEAAMGRKGSAVQQYLGDYERLNPKWREGAALPIAMRFDYLATGHILRRSARRMLRKRRQTQS